MMHILKQQAEEQSGPMENISAESIFLGTQDQTRDPGAVRWKNTTLWSIVSTCINSCLTLQTHRAWSEFRVSPGQSSLLEKNDTFLHRSASTNSTLGHQGMNFRLCHLEQNKNTDLLVISAGWIYNLCCILRRWRTQSLFFLQNIKLISVGFLVRFPELEYREEKKCCLWPSSIFFCLIISITKKMLNMSLHQSIQVQLRPSMQGKYN